MPSAAPAGRKPATCWSAWPTARRRNSASIARADYDGFDKRRAQAARRGLLRGIGMACYVESSGVAPSRFAGALGARVGFYEAASIRVEPDGAVRAMLGTHNHGQGHATTLAQILSSRFGV